MTRLAGLPLILLLSGLVGCARSPWAEAFTPAGTFGDAALLAPAEPAAPGDPAPVEVRTITWERMAGLLEQEEIAFTQTDVHPSDWDEDRSLAHRAMLLRGLQVQGDPAGIEVLGRSSFRALGTIRPLGADRDDLVRQARGVGATDVVVATTFLGRVDTIVDRPVTAVGGGAGFGWYGRRGSARSGLRSSTVWVPVRTEADQVGVVAFFLRRAGASG